MIIDEAKTNINNINDFNDYDEIKDIYNKAIRDSNNLIDLENAKKQAKKDLENHLENLNEKDQNILNKLNESFDKGKDLIDEQTSISNVENVLDSLKEELNFIKELENKRKNTLNDLKASNSDYEDLFNKYEDIINEATNTDLIDEAYKNLLDELNKQVIKDKKLDLYNRLKNYHNDELIYNDKNFNLVEDVINLLVDSVDEKSNIEGLYDEGVININNFYHDLLKTIYTKKLNNYINDLPELKEDVTEETLDNIKDDFITKLNKIKDLNKYLDLYNDKRVEYIKLFKALYVNDSIGDDNNDGTYNNPFKTLEKAINLAGENTTIKIQTDLTYDELVLEINKNIRITTADIDNENKDINSIKSIILNNSMLNVLSGQTLSIENIIIDGNNNFNTTSNRPLIQVQGSDNNNKAILNIYDGTIIKNANRNEGGSAILLKNANLYMYGGEISNNYNNNASIIGINSLEENDSHIYLYGGKIVNNETTASVIATHKNLKRLELSGNFVLEENNQSIPVNGFVVNENFSGHVEFVVSTDDKNKPINMEVVGNNKDFNNIRTTLDEDLFARFDGENYYWDYNYEEEFELIEGSYPTFELKGEIGKKAIKSGDVVYSNITEIPALNESNYKIDVTHDKVYFTYKEDENIVIEVDYQDYLNYLINNAIEEFNTYKDGLNLSNDYDELILELKNNINNTKNIFDVANNLEDAKTTLKLEVAKDKLKDDLNEYHELKYSTEDINYIKDIINKSVNTLNKDNFEIEYENIYQTAKDSIDQYYLEKTKEQLEDDLLIYIKDVIDEKTHLFDLIEQSKDLINIDNFKDEYETSLLNSKENLLSAEKNFAESYLKSYEDVSDEVKNIINNTLDIIDNENEIKLIKEHLNNAINEIDKQIELEEAKDLAIKQLDEYYNNLDEEDKLVVKDIINDAKEDINESNNLNTIKVIKDSAIDNSDLAILNNKKDNLINDLTNYYNDLTEDEKEVVLEIYNEFVDLILDENDINNLDDLYNEAINEINDAIFDDRLNSTILEVTNHYNDLIKNNKYDSINNDLLKDILENGIIELNNEKDINNLDLIKDEVINELEEFLNNLDKENKDLVESIINDAIETIEEALYDEIDDIKEEAINESLKLILDNLKDKAKQDVIDEYNRLTNEFEYSNDNLDSLDIFKSSGLYNIDEANNLDEINIAKNNAIERMNNVKTLDEEILDAKANLKDEILSNYDRNDYSEENYNELESIIDDALNELETLEEVTNFDDSNLIIELDEVPTLLDEAKERALSELKDAYDSYKEEDYSEENWTDLNQSYEDAKDAINNSETIEDVEDALESGKDAMSEIEAIEDIDYTDFEDKLSDIFNDYITSGEYSKEGLEDLNDIYNDILNKIQNGEYNDLNILETDSKELFDQVDIINSNQYDTKDPNIKYDDTNPKDYFSNVSNSKGMKKGYKVIVTNVEVVVNMKETVLDYIKNGNIKTLDDLIDKENIKNKSLFAQLEISLIDEDGNKVDSSEYEGMYEVSFLLPEEFENRENIKVVYLANNEVEVFKTSISDLGWITFETDHFSNFFLIADPLDEELEKINLWWLIITMLIIIVVEVITIIWKKGKNNELKTNSFVLPILAVLVPTNAYIFILILGIIILILLAYIIYLFLNKENYEEEIIEEKEEVTLEKSVTPSIPIKKAPRELYNYSFKARLHLADRKTVERFNEFKNYCLSYEGVSVSKTWRQETLLYKNESMVKIRVSGKTLNLYFNLNPSDYINTKYTFIDRSDVKTHERTPAQYQVTGPRKLDWAKELIDIYMKENEGIKKESYTNKDFSVRRVSRERLIKEGLIKVTEINKEYEDIIYSEED